MKDHALEPHGHRVAAVACSLKYSQSVRAFRLSTSQTSFVALVVGACCFSACRNTIVDDDPPGEGEGEGDSGTEGEGDGNCPAPDRPALAVRVHDNVTTFVICDADVSFDGGSGAVAAIVVGSSPDCVYQGGFDEAGSFKVTVAKAGYTTFENPAVVVDADDCGYPITREFDFGLDPT